MLTKWRIARSKLAQETATYAIPLVRFRETNGAYDNPLTNSATDTAFALSGGTHGTYTPKLQSKSADTNEKTSKCRVEFALPPEYVAGGSVTLRLRYKMSAEPNTSATLDAEVYETDRETGVVGSDICATAAQNIKTQTTYTDLDFTITPTALSAGDMLDIELTTVVNDTGGSGAHVVVIGSVQMLLAIKG